MIFPFRLVAYTMVRPLRFKFVNYLHRCSRTCACLSLQLRGCMPHRVKVCSSWHPNYHPRMYCHFGILGLHPQDLCARGFHRVCSRVLFHFFLAKKIALIRNNIEPLNFQKTYSFFIHTVPQICTSFACSGIQARILQGNPCTSIHLFPRMRSCSSVLVLKSSFISCLAQIVALQNKIKMLALLPRALFQHFQNACRASNNKQHQFWS